MSASADDVMLGMRRIRRALEARIRRDDRAERARAKPTLPRGRLADYDIAALGRLVRPMLERDGRGWRVVAAEIGVTPSDLSRIMAGQQIAAGKVFAICDWAGVNPRRFYRKPLSGSRGKGVAAKCFTGKALKRGSSAEGRR